MSDSTSNGEHRRSVRSFVRRAGRVTASQRRALDDLWPTVGVDFDARPLEFATLFGRKAPVVLEIGFGNGDSLVEQADLMPDHDFFGVEVHEPGIGHCLIRMREAGVKNLRVIAHDAVDVLEHMIPAGSLARINLYFPDPWPKKRHHKRRIVTPRFLDLCARALIDGGSVNIATDWENYAEHIDLTFEECERFRLDERREHDGDRPLDRPQTKFERRGLRHGHRIWDWRFVIVN